MRTTEQRILNAVQHPDRYREVLIDSDGLPVALSVWQGDPGEAAVLFLPGTMTHPLFYEEFLDALNGDGLTVVGLHPAAHGKSPRVRRRLTFDLLVRNVLDALDWTRNSFPEAPRVLLGSSQGGVLALAAAARATGVSQVVAHNVLDPTLPATLTVTRSPTWLRPAYPQLLAALRGLARLAPGLPVPFDSYLDIRRVCRNPEVVQRFYTDPLGRRSYPLAVVAGMLTQDVTTPVPCPVVVVAATGDPLFSLDYTRAVFDRIHAPTKDLVLVDSAEHLIFTEALEAVLPVLLPRLRPDPAASGTTVSRPVVAHPTTGAFISGYNRPHQPGRPATQGASRTAPR
jgi:alpha-beta hydrolase superfamily lysophospholipase